MLIPGINRGVNKSELLLSAGKMACGLPQPSCEKPKSAPVIRVKVGVAEPLGDALTLMTGVLPHPIANLESRTTSQSIPLIPDRPSAQQSRFPLLAKPGHVYIRCRKGAAKLSNAG